MSTPAFERRHDPVLADGVGGDPAVEPVGLAHDRPHLLLREVDLAAELAALQVILAVAVELDPVGAVLDLLADRLADLVGAVDDLHALGHLQLPRVAQQRIHAGRREGPGRDEHAGAGDDAPLDRPLHVHVGVHGPLGLQVADGREAVHQGGPGGDGGPDGAVGDRLLEQLLVVVGLGDVALEQDVGVGVDQAGQDGGLREVDDGGVPRGRLEDLVGRADRLDPLPLDQDRAVGRAPGRHGRRSGGRP